MVAVEQASVPEQWTRQANPGGQVMVEALHAVTPSQAMLQVPALQPPVQAAGQALPPGGVVMPPQVAPLLDELDAPEALAEPEEPDPATDEVEPEDPEDPVAPDDALFEPEETDPEEAAPPVPSLPPAPALPPEPKSTPVFSPQAMNDVAPTANHAGSTHRADDTRRIPQEYHDCGCESDGSRGTS
jgi:hypothetical protein